MTGLDNARVDLKPTKRSSHPTPPYPLQTDTVSSSDDGDDEDSGSPGSVSPAAQQRLRELQAAFDSASLTPGEALLVDAAGQPIATLGQLEPAARYPVQPTAHWRGGGGGENAPRAGSSGGRQQPSQQQQQQQSTGRQGGRQKQRSVVKGAAGGKLLPGEKARLRRDKIEAKRAARGAAQAGGFDVDGVVARLVEFVEEGGDMVALDPTSKHGLVSLVLVCVWGGLGDGPVGQRGWQTALGCVPIALAAFFNSRLVQIMHCLLKPIRRQPLHDATKSIPQYPTPKTSKPQHQAVTRALAGFFGLRASVQGSGKQRFMLVAATPRATLPQGPSAARLQALVAAEKEQQRLGRAALAAELPGGSRGGGAPAMQRQRSRGRESGEVGVGARKYQQPVAFVSRGAVDPNTAPTQLLPPASAARQQAAAAAADEYHHQQQQQEEEEDRVGVRSWPWPAQEEQQSESNDDDDEEEEEEEGEEEGEEGMEAEQGAAAGLHSSQQRRHQTEAARVGRFIESLLLSEDEGEEEEEGEEDEGYEEGSSSGGDGADEAAEEEQRVGSGALTGPSAAAAAAPVGWFEDLEPHHYGLGFTSSHGRRPATVAAAATVVQRDEGSDEDEQSLDAADAAAGPSSSRGGANTAPLYERASVGLGLGLRAALQQQQQQQPSRSKKQQKKLKQQRRREERLRGAAFDPFGLPPLHLAAEEEEGEEDEEDESDEEVDVTAAFAASQLGITKQQVLRAQKKAAKEARRAARRLGADADAGVGGGVDRRRGSAGGGGWSGGGEGDAVESEVVGHGIGFAAFEVHTTGIGSKLMASMGWSAGSGLGRARQGRAEPLKAAMRPKKQGLGFG